MVAGFEVSFPVKKYPFAYFKTGIARTTLPAS